jgi:DNA polymerase III alpha subunit
VDIDIDVVPSFDVTRHFPTATKASVLNGDKLLSHPCGAYFQSIPSDPITKLAAIPYEQAEELGYFKLDFLHVNVYRHFKSREEIKELIKLDPPWELMKSPSVVSQLFQLGKHYDLLQELKPTSVQELADVLALIRPSKRNLIKLYQRDRKYTRTLLYTIDEGDAYAFKKAHAIAYALVVVLQLHLLGAGVEISQ